jgi:hypothetical protein
MNAELFKDKNAISGHNQCGILATKVKEVKWRDKKRKNNRGAISIANYIVIDLYLFIGMRWKKI